METSQRSGKGAPAVASEVGFIKIWLAVHVAFTFDCYSIRRNQFHPVESSNLKQTQNLPASVEVIEKATRILEALADAPDGLSLQALATQTGLAKSTAHRLLGTWGDLGYVSRTSSGGYAAGIAVLELARKLVRRSRVAEIGREILRQLQRSTGESVYLGVYRDGKVVLLDGVEGSHPLRVVCDLGEQCYLHASAQGRAVAAYLDKASLRALLRTQGLPALTPKTLTDSRLILQRIAEDRDRGYSLNIEETVLGALCLGVPFFAGQHGSVVGSLGISIPLPRASASNVANCLNLLLASAQQLTTALLDFPVEPEALPRTPAELLTPVACVNPSQISASLPLGNEVSLSSQ